MVLKLWLLHVIHHSNVLKKSYAMLGNCFPFQIYQMSMYSYAIIDFFHVKSFSENLKKEA